MAVPSFRIEGIQGFQFGNANVTYLKGRPGFGFFRLDIGLKINTTTITQDDKQAELIDLFIDLDCQGVPVARAQSAPGQSVFCGAASAELSYRLYVDFQPIQLAALEHVRNGGALKLEGTPCAVLKRFVNKELVTTLGHQFLLSINQSDWIDVLRDMGYKDILLVEIPLSVAQGTVVMTQEVNDLRLAQQEMLAGRWRGAVAHCRDALELLIERNRNGTIESIQEIAAVAFNLKPDARSKEQRLAVMGTDMYRLAHLSKHRKGSAQFTEWDRDDALAAISITAMLLRLQADRELAT